MSGRFWATLPVVVPVVCVALIMSAGMTNAYGSGTQLHANVGGWIPDGAKADTFWNASIIDVPGLSVYAVHCHGQMRSDVQLGATSPPHSNPCLAAMGAYSGGSEEWGVYMTVPGTSAAIYRSSVNYGPWTYSISDLVYESSPPPRP
jgi:hypothetical protein